MEILLVLACLTSENKGFKRDTLATSLLHFLTFPADCHTTLHYHLATSLPHHLITPLPHYFITPTTSLLPLPRPTTHYLTTPLPHYPYYLLPRYPTTSLLHYLRVTTSLSPLYLTTKLPIYIHIHSYIVHLKCTDNISGLEHKPMSVLLHYHTTTQNKG